MLSSKPANLPRALWWYNIQYLYKLCIVEIVLMRTWYNCRSCISVLFDLFIDGIDPKNNRYFGRISRSNYTWSTRFPTGEKLEVVSHSLKSAFFWVHPTVSALLLSFKQLSDDLCMHVCDNFESVMRVECPCQDYHTVLNVIWFLITYSFPCN